MREMPPIRVPRLLDSRVHQFSTPFPLGVAEEEAIQAMGLRLPGSLAKAAPKRQAEFLAGRYCARKALAEAGFDQPFEITVLSDRSPVWPEGWVGSITHARGLAAAAVARKTDLAGIGIDSEPVMEESTASEVRSRILRDGEEAVFAQNGVWSPSEQVTLVFSAKESIYKCLRPLTGRFFGFEDAQLTGIDEARGVFKFSLKTDIGGGFGPGWQGKGLFRREENWIHTAMALEASEFASK